MEPTAQRVKIVGHRRQPSGGLVAAAPLLELVVRLRGNKPFLPKGVHRFTTHEESNAWSMRMMARRLNPDLPRSPTSSHFAGT
ncbi:MAG: hypothetical protein HYZ28_23700 [Myxococcales bacterium]|nr:hypothetical protein [Myxococcales bacterium]